MTGPRGLNGQPGFNGATGPAALTPGFAQYTCFENITLDFNSMLVSGFGQTADPGLCNHQIMITAYLMASVDQAGWSIYYAGADQGVIPTGTQYNLLTLNGSAIINGGQYMHAISKYKHCCSELSSQLRR